MRAWEIGIIGGGPGGLMTAYTIQKWANDPFRITLLEASDRLGGKILTRQFDSVSAHYEAGAAEIYDYSHMGEDPLKELIAELGLPIARMEGSTAVVGDRPLANLDDMHDRYGPDAVKAFAEFNRRAKDRITPQEFYSPDPEAVGDPSIRRGFDVALNAIPVPEVRSYVEQFIHSDLATEPENTSLAYGLQNYLMNDHAYMSLYGIAGGNEALPRELAKRLNAEIRLRHRVASIEKTAEGRMAVTTECRGSRSVSTFDAVVVALPNAAMRNVVFRGNRLASAMAEHRAEYDHPAHYLRVTIAFRKKFWHGKLNESYCMLDQFGGCCLYDESSRNPGGGYPVLGWLIAGEAAEALAGLSDEQLIEKALDSLPSYFSHGREWIVEGRVHRWLDAVNAIPGGLQARTLDWRHRPEPVDHPNLFAVGDYLFDSTLNGVLDSANYAAMWIVSLLADTPKESHDRPAALGTPRAIADKYRPAPVLARR